MFTDPVLDNDQNRHLHAYEVYYLLRHINQIITILLKTVIHAMEVNTVKWEMDFTVLIACHWFLKFNHLGLMLLY